MQDTHWQATDFSGGKVSGGEFDDTPESAELLTSTSNPSNLTMVLVVVHCTCRSSTFKFKWDMTHVRVGPTVRPRRIALVRPASLAGQGLLAGSVGGAIRSLTQASQGKHPGSLVRPERNSNI